MDDFTCYFCSTTYANRTLYRAHMASEHNELIPACCAECMTVEGSIGKVLLHQKTMQHTMCPMCPQTFESFDPLTKHYVEAHITQNTGSSGVRHYCTECYKDFPSLTMLKEHVSQNHPYIWSELFSSFE